MDEKYKLEIEKALSGKPHIFRTDRSRQAIDGCSAGVLANMDCAGTGPKESFFIGRKIAYPIAAYIEWVVSRISQAK